MKLQTHLEPFDLDGLSPFEQAGLRYLAQGTATTKSGLAIPFAGISGSVAIWNHLATHHPNVAETAAREVIEHLRGELQGENLKEAYARIREPLLSYERYAEIRRIGAVETIAALTHWQVRPLTNHSVAPVMDLYEPFTTGTSLAPLVVNLREYLDTHYGEEFFLETPFHHRGFEAAPPTETQVYAIRDEYRVREQDRLSTIFQKLVN